MLTGKTKNVHYGWVVCAACALALFCTSGLSVNAFTVYQPYLIQSAGLTNTESSTIITVRSFFSFASVFFVGLFYQKISLRVGLTLAMAIEATGFLLFGFGSDFWCYCLAASLVGCAYGVGTMVPVTMLVNRWFEDRRSIALGICSAATGLSTVGVPSLITWSVENIGLLITFCGEALFMLLCGVTCLALVRDTPERKQSAPYRSKSANEVKVARISNNRALEPHAWVAVIPTLIALGAASTVAFSHLGVLEASEGFNSQDIAAAITLTGVSLMIGKVGFGQLADRFSAAIATLVFGCAMAIGLLVLSVAASSASLLFLGSVLYGSGVSLSSVGLMAWATDLSSKEQIDKNVQRFQLCFGAGGFLLSPLPGITADANFGNYAPVYIAFALMSVFVIMSILKLYRLRKPVSQPEQRITVTPCDPRNCLGWPEKP